MFALYDLYRSAEPLAIGQWHTAKVMRQGRDGKLKVDDQKEVHGMSKGAYTQLTLSLDLFVGGHRNFDEVAKSADVKVPFKGCVQKVSATACVATFYMAKKEMTVISKIVQCCHK